ASCFQSPERKVCFRSAVLHIYHAVRIGISLPEWRESHMQLDKFYVYRHCTFVQRDVGLTSLSRGLLKRCVKRLRRFRSSDFRKSIFGELLLSPSPQNCRSPKCTRRVRRFIDRSTGLV